MPTGVGTAGGAAGMLLLGTLVLGGAAVYDMGAVRVSVQEKKPGGDHVRLLIPAVAVPLGLRIAPEEKLREAALQARPWLPALRIASQELERCPDGPLVEVTNPHEKVSIVKRGHSLLIDVDSEDETVHVSVPLRAVTSVVERLETVAERADERASADALSASPPL
jgi:hypothetical protein